MSDDSRASRLRSRRGRARRRADEQQGAGDDTNDGGPEESTESTNGTATTDTGDGESAADQESSVKQDGPSGSVKDERVGTYMYLPESQKRELERVYGTLKVQYEYEFDEEFEKNRHFFPAVVRHGLENLDGMDATEVRAVVEDL